MLSRIHCRYEFEFVVWIHSLAYVQYCSLYSEGVVAGDGNSMKCMGRHLPWDSHRHRRHDIYEELNVIVLANEMNLPA